MKDKGIFFGLVTISTRYQISKAFIFNLLESGKISCIREGDWIFFEMEEVVKLEKYLPVYDSSKELTLVDRQFFYNEGVKKQLEILIENFDRRFKNSQNRDRLLKQEKKLFENLFFEESAPISNQIISNVNYHSLFEFGGWRFSTVEVKGIRQVYNKIIEQGNKDYSFTKHPKEPITFGGGDSHYIKVEAFWSYLNYLTRLESGQNGHHKKEELPQKDLRIALEEGMEIRSFFMKLLQCNPENTRPYWNEYEIDCFLSLNFKCFPPSCKLGDDPFKPNMSQTDLYRFFTDFYSTVKNQISDKKKVAQLLFLNFDQFVNSDSEPETVYSNLGKKCYKSFFNKS